MSKFDFDIKITWPTTSTSSGWLHCLADDVSTVFIDFVHIF